MTFTPEQVETMEFLTAVRGYDKEEVRKFLGALADEMRAAQRNAESIEKEMESPQLPAGPAPELDDAARLTAELGRHLSTAVRLVETLDELSSASAASIERTATSGPRDGDTSAPAPAGGREPLRQVATSQATAPPPEWEELLADPETDRS